MATQRHIGWPISAFLMTGLLAVTTTVLLLANLLGWKISGHSYSVETGGDVAEWVAGLGTVAAIFSGIWVFRRQSRETAEALQTSAEQLRLSQLDFRSRELQVKAAQAKNVVAWLDAVGPDIVIRDYPQHSENFQDLETMFNQAKRRHMADLYTMEIRSRSDQRPLTQMEFGELDPPDRERLAPGYETLRMLQERFGENGPSASCAILCICISNASDSPIFALKIQIQASGHEASSLRIAADNEQVLSVPVLPPAREPRLFPLSLINGNLALIPGHQISLSTLQEYSVCIRFIDSGGGSWIRNGDGQLEVADQEASAPPSS